MRSTAVRVGLLAVLLLSGGCMETVEDLREGGGSLEFSADPVHVEEGTVAESNYDLAADKEVSFNQSVEVQEQSHEVDLSAHMVHLTRSYEGATLGNVVLLSVPQVEVLGQQIDVAEEVGPESLLEKAQGRTGTLERSQKLEERSVQMLGQNRTVEVFSGTATTDGSETRAKIYVVVFDHQGDTIVGVGIVPQIDGADPTSVLELFESVRYG